MYATDNPRELFAQQAEVLKKALETARSCYDTELERYRSGIGEWGAVEVASHQFWLVVATARNMGFDVSCDGVTMDVYSVAPGAIIEQGIVDWSEE